MKPQYITFVLLIAVIEIVSAGVMDTLNEYTIVRGSKNTSKLIEYEIYFKSLYESDPFNATTNFFVGIVTYSNADIKSSIHFLQSACFYDDFNTTEFVVTCANVLREAGYMKESVNVVLNGIRRNEFSKSLNELLIELHIASNCFEDAYDALKKILRIWPNHYPYWVRFVDFSLTLLSKEVYGSEQFNSSSIDNADLDTAVIRGLGIFPSCPGLLYLRAISYVKESNNLCAALFFEKSLSKVHFAQSNMEAEGVLDNIKANFRIQSEILGKMKT